MRLGPALLLALLAVTFASEESCMGRCENGYSSEKTCQCDSMCKYYRSCCYDYQVVCRMTTRGDTFVLAEDDDDLLDSTAAPAAGRSSDDESDSIVPRRSTPGLHPVSTPAVSTTQDIPLTEPEITQAPLDVTPQRPLDVTTQRPLDVTPQRPLDVTPQRVSSTQVAPVSQRVSTTPMVPVTQADTNAMTAEVTTATTVEVTTATTIDVTTATTVEVTTDMTTTSTKVVATTTEAPDPDAHKCSGRPFDSFMQMKNGSMFAFRGDYFFELGRRTVMPGYPKLIKDVWGIRGPIDAAFTRVNCQGKTYIFKGNKYWRFDDGVLDDDYPRQINVGFDKVPDHVDAAFALPAHSHHGKEKVFFFKGDQYFQYEFLHQPSHDECVSMNQRSPSTLFSRYTDLYYNHDQHFLSQLFPDTPQGHGGHHFINKDWKGIKSPVDAVMAGRLYIPPLIERPTANNQPYQHHQRYQQYVHQWDQQYGQQWSQHRQRRSSFWESITKRGMGVGQGFAERGMEMALRLAERRTEMEERLRRDWDRRNDRDRDQDRRNNDQNRDQDRRNNDQNRDQDRRNNDQEQGRGYDQNRDQNRDPNQDQGRDQDRDQDRRHNDQDRDRHRYNSGIDDSRDNRDDGARGELRGLPQQNIYFFKGDKYYRVDLKTKKVDPASPPYPRSIAQYWLGCSDTTGQERK